MPLTKTEINDIQQAFKPMLTDLKNQIGEGFKKQFDEFAARQLASAKEVDFSNAPVRTDAAVWSDGTEHYIWQDPDGMMTPIDVDYPPIVHPNWTSDGKGSSFRRPDEKEVRAKHNWRLRYLPDQALGNQSFEVIMKEGEQDGADKRDHEQAKLRLYELRAGRQLVLPPVLGRLGAEFPEQPGVIHPDAANAGGGAVTGTTEVGSGMGGFAGGGPGPNDKN